MDFSINYMLMEATASANTAATEEVGMGVLLLQLLPMVILVVFMYLLMIRPQKKKEIVTHFLLFLLLFLLGTSPEEKGEGTEGNA